MYNFAVTFFEAPRANLAGRLFAAIAAFAGGYEPLDGQQDSPSVPAGVGLLAAIVFTSGSIVAAYLSATREMWPSAAPPTALISRCSGTRKRLHLLPPPPGRKALRSSTSVRTMPHTGVVSVSDNIGQLVAELLLILSPRQSTWKDPVTGKTLGVEWDQLPSETRECYRKLGRTVYRGSAALYGYGITRIPSSASSR